MKITRHQLRRIIREQLLLEKSIASVSDISRQRDFMDEWADLLLDELSERLPNGAAINDWKESTRQARIEGIRSAVTSYLITALGYAGDEYGQRRQRWKEEEKIAKHHTSQKMRGLR